MVSETEFHGEVEHWLNQHYGAGSVEHEVWLDDTDRRCDFLVDAPLATWAIEVENEQSDVIDGIGQALLYADHDPEYVPCVIYPETSQDAVKEASYLDRHVRVLGLSPR